MSMWNFSNLTFRCSNECVTKGCKLSERTTGAGMIGKGQGPFLRSYDRSFVNSKVTTRSRIRAFLRLRKAQGSLRCRGRKVEPQYPRLTLLRGRLLPLKPMGMNGHAGARSTRFEKERQDGLCRRFSERDHQSIKAELQVRL
jgi:hypothetical protein